MTSLFPKSDKLHELPTPPTHPWKTRQLHRLPNHASINSCRNFSTFPKQTAPPPAPEFPQGSRGINTRVQPRGRNLGIVPSARGGTGTKADPSSGGILWEVEGWDAPRTKVENQSKKDGNQPGPRADPNPSAPGMRGGGVRDIANSQSLWLALRPEPRIQADPTLENGKTGTQRAGSAYWYCAGLDGIFTCWNQRNSGKTGSCECRHRDEWDQTRGGRGGILLQELLPPRICPEHHHRAKETQGAVGVGSDERKRGIGSGMPGIGSGIPEKSSAGGGKGPRASLEVAIALALDGFLDAQQHRGEPLIQPRDGVEFLHCLGVGLAVLLLMGFQQFFQ